MEADKKMGGLSIKAFKDFLLKDGYYYSVQYADDLDIKDKEKPGAEIRDWVVEHFIGKFKHSHNHSSNSFIILI